MKAYLVEKETHDYDYHCNVIEMVSLNIDEAVRYMDYMIDTVYAAFVLGDPFQPHFPYFHKIQSTSFNIQSFTIDDPESCEFVQRFEFLDDISPPDDYYLNLDAPLTRLLLNS